MQLVCLSVYLCVLTTIQREVHRRRIHPIMLRGPNLVFRVGDEARGAEVRGQGSRAGVGLLGKGSQSPPHKLGSAVLSSSPGSGQSPDREKVFLHSRGATWPLLELVGGQVRRGVGVAPLAPLNPPMGPDPPPEEWDFALNQIYTVSQKNKSTNSCP